MEPRSKQLLDDLTHRLNKARSERQALQRELTEFELIISGFEQTIGLLRAQMESDRIPRAEAVASTSRENLDAVIKVLRLNGKGMRRKDIAKRAHELQLISSTKGAEGVDAIVGNILSRNAPRLFVNTGWGWWDLAERNKAEQPLRFPREKEPETESPKTIH